MILLLTPPRNDRSMPLMPVTEESSQDTSTAVEGGKHARGWGEACNGEKGACKGGGARH
jgi:hypothetical protein